MGEIRRKSDNSNVIKGHVGTANELLENSIRLQENYRVYMCTLRKRVKRFLLLFDALSLKFILEKGFSARQPNITLYFRSHEKRIIKG